LSRPLLPVPGLRGRAGRHAYEGTPVEVASALVTDPCLPSTTHLLCHTQPARLTLAELHPVLHGLVEVRRHVHDLGRVADASGDHAPSATT
jgi:hypothetical protein